MGMELKALALHKAGDGDYPDGHGLHVKIVKGRARATFRFTSPAGIRREMGLGPINRSSLAETGRGLTIVRDLAHEKRKLLREGIDPIEKKNADREQELAVVLAAKAKTKAEAMTLARAARSFHEREIEPQKKLTEKHKGEWIASLERCVPEELWHRAVDTIDAPTLLDAMVPLQSRVPETARRVRQRLELVFDDLEFRGGLASGKNPARAIRSRMERQAPERSRDGFRFLPYAKVPTFVRQLRGQPGVAARALEFALLTASRTAEVIGATWDEFNFEAREWTVPAERMKAGEKHVVHLSDAAINVLTEVRVLDDQIVFLSPARKRQALSNMGMLELIKRMKLDKVTTVHGLCRKSFSTWANETGAARPDVIEAALAHRESNAVRAAYNRAQFLQERRQLLDSWASFCAGKVPASNVVPLSQKVA